MMNYRSSISLQRYSPTVALRQIQAAPDNDNLARSAGILPELACILINNKTAVSQDNRLITDFADMTMVRAIELAVGKLGRPPIGVFGNFIVENKRHKTDVLDIKSVMNLVVDFARIYALKHGLKERNTHERLKALREASIFSDQSYYELKIALSYLMRIGLGKQAVSIDHVARQFCQPRPADFDRSENSQGNLCADQEFSGAPQTKMRLSRWLSSRRL
ncbi:hypothetical protein MASR1M12_29840 [Erysipelotrichia bacterium]